MSYKIAIIGNEDAINGFKAVGVEAVGVKSVAECQTKLGELHQSSDYAIIFITEDWADKIRKFMDDLPPKALPSIVAVPSQTGSTGAGLRSLKKIVEQAVGSDILSND
ncbi:MAG: V-type ATP synthase subunit F [Patescibacteria group bacterium]|jgi:V/A-type H+-transporting ATPase subunit F|nr:V-type ATP synthase subunit F [Patescibacteria group bacterium]